jgi:predicted nucleic acid-binding protein
MSVEFCDTNILVYARDAAAGVKHDRARLLVERLWRDQTGALSIQILQELYVSLTRKLSPAFDAESARPIVASLSTWQVVEPRAAHVLSAIDATSRWRVSFWDAMMLTAAHLAGARVVWSEDLNDGQSYDGLIVRNPLLTDAPTRL